MPTDSVALDAFIGFCEAARQYGNGTIEISARGSLQVRGLTPRSAPLFASAVAELGIVAHEGVSVVADPLVHDVGVTIDTADTAAELRRTLANARLVLSPKVSVVVDGGGRLHLDVVSADIRLRAAGPAQRPRLWVGLGGDGASATWLGSIAPKEAVGVVLDLLTMIAAHGPTARAADILRAEGVEAFHSVSAAWIAGSPAPPRRMAAQMVGLHPARDGTLAIGIGLAFGHAHADALAQIVSIAASHGAQAVRPAPDRAMLLIGAAAQDVVDLTATVERLGFVVRADDPRRRIAACPGAPACASGLMPARALAAALTPTLEPILEQRRNGVSVHISGCPKGCAHPMPAALTLVGTPRGCGIVHHGSARAPPGHYVDPADLGAEISRIVAKTNEAAHG
jgi:precorrin-3B synthase